MQSFYMLDELPMTLTALAATALCNNFNFCTASVGRMSGV